MKKIDLVHTTILIVAILAGYSAVDYLIYGLSILSYGGDLFYLQSMGARQLLYNLISSVLFSTACVILVKNGRKYAAALLKDEPEASWENAPQWQLDQKHILFVLFIGIGLYTLIQSTPFALEKLYEAFRDKVSRDPMKGAPNPKTSLAIELLRITIGACLIYAAPTLTNFVHKNIAGRLESQS